MLNAVLVSDKSSCTLELFLTSVAFEDLAVLLMIAD